MTERPRIEKDPVCGMSLASENAACSYVCTDFGGKKYCFCSEICKNSFLEHPRIAYFSMEIGIENAKKIDREIDYRTLGDNWEEKFEEFLESKDWLNLGLF